MKERDLELAVERDRTSWVVDYLLELAAEKIEHAHRARRQYADVSLLAMGLEQEAYAYYRSACLSAGCILGQEWPSFSEWSGALYAAIDGVDGSAVQP